MNIQSVDPRFLCVPVVVTGLERRLAGREVLTGDEARRLMDDGFADAAYAAAEKRWHHVGGGRWPGDWLGVEWEGIQIFYADGKIAYVDVLRCSDKQPMPLREWAIARADKAVDLANQRRNRLVTRATRDEVREHID